jgi:hypothetical protein
VSKHHCTKAPEADLGGVLRARGGERAGTAVAQLRGPVPPGGAAVMRGFQRHEQA